MTVKISTMETVDILLTRVLVNMLKMSINVVTYDVASLQFRCYQRYKSRAFVLIIELSQVYENYWTKRRN